MPQKTALQRHLDEQGRGALTALAVRAECSKSRLSRIAGGERASFDLAARIVAATGGAVTMADLGYAAPTVDQPPAAPGEAA